jgi:tRNA pseudouridine55 synthase
LLNGAVNVDKPAGITSHDVVYRIRKLASQKRVGHAGTLDPDATGVLLVCLGHATRLSDLLADQGKEYEAVLRLGVSTSTEDASGDVITTVDPSEVSETELLRVLLQFVGEIQQVPPMVSAVHHEGKRLYDLARQGVVVDRAARPVHIDSIDLLSFKPGEYCSALLRVSCGKGTYIRTLCADIGATLGVGGHMAALRRTAVGRFGVREAVTLDTLARDGVARYLVSPSAAVSFLDVVELSAEQKADVLNGKVVRCEDREAGQLVRLVYGEELVGLGRILEGGSVQPEKVFPG